jgi:hypothetical protein
MEQRETKKRKVENEESKDTEKKEDVKKVKDGIQIVGKMELLCVLYSMCHSNEFLHKSSIQTLQFFLCSFTYPL